MLAKRTSRNRITLPKGVLNVIGQSEYFDVRTKNGQIILTPVRIQHADAVRVKLAHLRKLDEEAGRAETWRIET